MRAIARISALALAIAASSGTALAHGHDHDHDHDHGSSQRPHVHGLAHLDGALDGKTLTLQLQTPGWDLVGFERAPRDDAERAKVDAAKARLEDGASLFAFEPAGACAPSAAAKLTLPAALSETAAADQHDHDHSHDHDHDHDHKHDHGEDKGASMHGGDWLISWEFQCADPAALKSIRVNWFDAFPGTERAQVQWIGPTGQGGYELTAASRLIPVASP